jgi:hypothetical protein
MFYDELQVNFANFFQMIYEMQLAIGNLLLALLC